ncbi:MAG: hybrid sensor histidine kinase/response regulator [Sphingobacteriia bacterium]
MTNITIIDDDAEILDSLKTILELNGYATNIFDNGTSFLNEFDSLNQDLILCDMMMPERDGMSVLLEFKTHKKNIPFIFLTAKAQYDDLRQAMINGADDYIFKPFTTKDLLLSIESRISKSVDIKDKIKNLENTIQLMVGHEFNTPMHGIEFFSNMIAKKSNLIHDADLNEYCNYLELSVKRLQRTFSKAQLYYQLIDGTYLKQEPTLLPNLDDFILNIFHENAERFNRINDLHVYLTSGCSIKIDKYLFSCLIAEICENAFKFSKPNTEIKISSTIENLNTLCITISDKGLNKEALRISEMTEFNQFERQQYEQQGLGIGIVLVKKIAKVLGCKLFFDNNIPHGLIVRLLLPL